MTSYVLGECWNNMSEEEVKDIVIMGIEAIPLELKVSIGNGKSLTKEEMIKHVEKGDEIGKQTLLRAKNSI